MIPAGVVAGGCTALIDIPWFDTLLEAPDKTQARLAEVLGVSASAITRLKTDERQLQGREYLPFAEYFGIEVAEVHRHVGRNLDSTPPATSYATNEKPSPPPVGIGMVEKTDGVLLGNILEILKRVFDEEAMPCTSEQLGEMAAAEYDDIVVIPDEPERRLEELARLENRIHREIGRCRNRTGCGFVFPNNGKGP